MRPRSSLATLPMLLLLSCVDHEPPTAPAVSQDPRSAILDIEGEVLVRITRNGQSLTSADTGLYVSFYPVGLPDIEGAQQWYNPSENEGYGAQWFDPQASDGSCRPDPVTGMRGPEVHAGGPGFPASGEEMHCARPARYTIVVRASGTVVTQFDVEYAQAAQAPLGQQINVWNQTAQIDEVIASPVYVAQSGEQGVVDLGVHIDIQSTAQHTETAVLFIENAESDYKKTVFSNQLAPAGNEQDYFRFSVAASSTNWISETKQALLTKFWWDTRFLGSVSGYYDLHMKEPQHHMLAVHRYIDDADRSEGLVEVGIDLKRPDEAPRTTPQLTRTVSLVRTDSVPAPPSVTACMNVETSAPGVMTDQYLTVGPSNCATRGFGIEYRWFAGGIWTAFSPDTLHDFAGFSASGAGTLIVEARNPAGERARDTVVVNTTAGGIYVDGQYDIREKLRYQYRARDLYTHAPAMAWWFERSNPQLTWYDKYLQDSVITRIWAMGDYTTELRAQIGGGGGLRRGRLHVQVCSQFCTPETAQGQADGGDVFGAGPILLGGAGGDSDVIALYDLAGDYLPGTPFAEPGWLQSEGGATRVGGYQVSWNRASSQTPDIQQYVLDVVPEGGRPYLFGFAIDPDLSGSPANDRAAFDESLGIAYVHDATAAMAVILLDPENRAVRRIQQFGSRRPAPPARAGMATVLALRNHTVHTDADDVQFVLQGETRTGPSRWMLIIVRGADPSAVRMIAETLLPLSRE